MKNCDLVNYYSKALKENGLEQTYDWTLFSGGDASRKDLIKYAESESQSVADSDFVVILLPAGRGAHIELGMALALNKTVFLCSHSREEFSYKNTVAFYELPNIIKLVGTADENINKIIKRVKK